MSAAGTQQTYGWPVVRSAFDPKRTWIPIDLAQGAGSKSSLWLFVTLADAIISISPNSGGPWPNEDRSDPGSLYFPAEGGVGTVIPTFAFHSGLYER